MEPAAGSLARRRRDDANCDTGGETDYTPEAMRAKIQGLVTLEVVVLRDGTPGDIRIVRSLDPGGLDRQAIAAVREWRFNPGRLNGVPVDVLVTIELSFRIY